MPVMLPVRSARSARARQVVAYGKACDHISDRVHSGLVAAVCAYPKRNVAAQLPTS